MKRLATLFLGTLLLTLLLARQFAAGKALKDDNDAFI